MNEFRAQCIALYEQAFPGESADFTKALFDRYFPEHIRTVCEDGVPVAMLFSIPYPLVCASGTVEARYLYGVATDEQYRGRGLAKRLLTAEASLHPVFLRPMTVGLFDFYAKAGFSPISPLLHGTGEATAPTGEEHLLDSTAYLAKRAAHAPLPTCTPTKDLLFLYEQDGGFAACGERAVALFERHGEEILFKEYWGDTDAAPAIAAFLGGRRFSWRRYDATGIPFGMAVGIPAESAFLAALD